MKLRERVAEARRRLPQGPEVKDYEFLEGDSPTRAVRLSQLFTGPDRSLVIYHFMYGKRQATPCPMCTLWIDGNNGVAHHIAQNVDFAIVAAADRRPTRARPPARLEQSAPAQRWPGQHVQVRSRQRRPQRKSGLDDLGLHAGSDGTVRHFYSAHPRMASEIKERGIDLMTPIYNLLDLTPQGRGNWDASLDYAPTKS